MVTLALLVVLLALVAIGLRGSSGSPLEFAERIFLALSPLPVLLALVLPGPVGTLMRDSGSGREWALWLNVVGGWLSLLLTVAGVALWFRRHNRELAFDWRLQAGLLAAALPALLIGMVALMYAAFR